MMTFVGRLLLSLLQDGDCPSVFLQESQRHLVFIEYPLIPAVQFEARLPRERSSEAPVLFRYGVCSEDEAIALCRMLCGFLQCLTRGDMLLGASVYFAVDHRRYLEREPKMMSLSWMNRPVR